MEPKTPWMGEYTWEENKCDGSAPQCVPLPDEVIAMFRPSKCLLCGTVTSSQQSAFTHYESKGHFKKVTQHMREKYNVLGTLKSKEKFRLVRCEICQIDLTSRVVLMQHYEGKQHSKNLKKRSSDGAPAVAETKETADATTTKSEGDFENPMDFFKDLPPPPPLPKLGTYFCSLCQVKTKSKGQMEIHNSGSRHMKNLSKLADGELKEFFLRNGNCEPVEADGQDPTPPSTPARDNQSVSSFPQAAVAPPVGGYPYPPAMDPSGGMPMTPSPYPQMPYGQYPQYPMGYDYNAWNQGQQGYNAGPPPFNDYNAAQQQYGQPRYNTGPYPYPQNQQQYPANQQQYPANHQQYPANNQQQYPANQQQYPTNQQQYPANQQQQYPANQQQYSATQSPFLSGPPPPVAPPQNFSEPCPAAPGTTDTPMMTENTTTSSRPVSSQAIPGPFGERKEDRSTHKDIEVRESPLPDNFEIQPLAVSNFIKLLAQEAKLEKESNKSLTNPHSEAETVDCGKAVKTGEGDSANPTAEVDYSPENEAPTSAVKMNDSAKGEVNSVGIEMTDSPAGKADDGVGVTDPTAVEASEALSASEVVGENHTQNGVNHNFNIGDASKSTSDTSVGEEHEEISNSVERSKEESDKSPEGPSSRNGELELDQGGKFIATGFTEANKGVEESVEAPVGNANKTSSDAFKFKIGAKSTLGKPKVNTFFRMSTEKMLKEAKEKKRPEFKKMKESPVLSKSKGDCCEAPPKEGSVDVITNVSEETREANNAQPLKDVAIKEKPLEGNIPKDLEKGKLDKSEGEISDDLGDSAAVVSSELKPESSSVFKATCVPRNSISESEDRVDNQDELEKKNSSKGEQIQNDTPNKLNSSPEKVKPSTKKFSASDKKKVSRTRNSSSDASRKSRSRSRSRRKRNSRRHSSSWSPSSEDESKKNTLNNYHGKNDNYGQENYQNYYGYNNRNRNWRNNRGYYQDRGFHQRNYWDHQRYGGWDNQEDYNYERQVEETDEFGREKRRREDKKKEKRESRKRKKERRKSPSAGSLSSRSSSGSRSRSRKKRSKGEKKHKSSKKHPSPDIKMKKTKQTPEAPKERIISNASHVDAKQTPLTLAQKLRLEKSDRISDTVPVEQKELPSDEIEVPVGDSVQRVVKQTSPETAKEGKTVVVTQKALLQKPALPSKFLEVLEKEREKQEILKKMALIKLKMQQKEKEKSAKKKKKKEKSKKKKKKRSSSTSSSSSSSSSSSDSSSSSSSSSSSQSESLAEKLLAKMRKDAKGPGPSSVLPDLAKVLPLLKKKEPGEASKKKKKKKDVKAKNKKSKKSRKAEPSQSTLAAYVTPSGKYYCKNCNLTLASGNSFVEHLLTEKHKLMYKLVKEKKAL